MDKLPVSLLVCGVGYLIGSFPTGYLLAKARGVDIQSVGSRSIGATNVARNLGAVNGVIVLVVDALKGVVAILVGLITSGSSLKLFFAGDAGVLLPGVFAGAAAVVGHNFPVWLKFHGGKGVATTAGIAFFLWPKISVFAFVIWIASFLFSQCVSVASITAAVSLPIWFFIWAGQSERGDWNALGFLLSQFIVTIFLALLIIFRHHENIRRLMAGTEPKFRFKGRAAAPKSKS